MLMETYWRRNSSNQVDIDRKWPCKHMYCKKHNYGPMDDWYDCTECCNEIWDTSEAQGSDKYKFRNRGTYKCLELIGRGVLKVNRYTPRSRRKLHRYHRMSTIYMKISRNAAEELIAMCPLGGRPERGVAGSKDIS